MNSVLLDPPWLFLEVRILKGLREYFSQLLILNDLTPEWTGGVRGYTLRWDEKSAEVIDKKEVEMAPWRKRVRN